jgi:hypothetical protein
MTIYEVLKEIKPHKGKITRRQCYRYMDACQIRPLGARQRPQQYPADTAGRILAHLGFAVKDQKQETPLQKENRIAAAFGIKPVSKLISVRTLRAAKPQKQTKGTK